MNLTSPAHSCAHIRHAALKIKSSANHEADRNPHDAGGIVNWTYTSQLSWSEMIPECNNIPVFFHSSFAPSERQGAKSPEEPEYTDLEQDSIMPRNLSWRWSPGGYKGISFTNTAAYSMCIEMMGSAFRPKISRRKYSVPEHNLVQN